MELEQNKVVPSKPERERQGYSDRQCLRQWEGFPPNTLLDRLNATDQGQLRHAKLYFAHGE